MEDMTISLIKGARTYCIINEQTSQLLKNAIGSCTIDKNSKKNFFCASKNGTLTVPDRSTTRVPKSSRGFLELSIQNGEKY